LFLDDIVENIWISDKSAALIDVDFGDDVNEQNIAGIGLFLKEFSNQEYIRAILDVFMSLDQIELSSAVRCETGVINEQILDYCAMYTRYLTDDRAIIVTTNEGYQQFAADNFPTFTEGKLYKTNLGIVMMVHPVRDWDETTRNRYRTLLSKARKEAGI